MEPVLSITSNIHVASYLITMSLAFTISVIYFYKRALQMHLEAKVSTEISIVIMVGGFWGARLFHILFEYPSYYWQHPLEIFKIYKGGFVFYGGFLGALLTSYIYLRRSRQNVRLWLDAFALVLPIGYMIGRVGCLLAGCCYGRECNLPWAIKFGPGVEAPAGVPLHPTQIYAILLEFIIWNILFQSEKKKIFKNPGCLFYSWMTLHGFARLILEHFRGDYRGDIVGGLSISFFISLALIAVGSMLIYRQAFKINESTSSTSGTGQP